jgi:hypothetical protein
MMTEIKSAAVIKSDLYERCGEFGPIHVYDCQVLVTTLCGEMFIHDAFVAKGYAATEDGFDMPNCNAVDEARKFAAKVLARGFINTAYWRYCLDEIRF